MPRRTGTTVRLATTLALTGENIGDQLNAHDLSWGWFQGGFTPATPYSGPVSTATNYNQLNNPDAVQCTSTDNVGAALGGTGKTGAKPWGTKADYSAHYDGFQFYASTANPHHLAPASLGAVGTDTATPGEFDTANHNYDTTTFNSLVNAITERHACRRSNFPAVTYLKAPVYETGHPATSDPVDEQNWMVKEINEIESLAHLEEHGDLPHLRRLGRLVRPRVRRRDQPLRHDPGRPYRRGLVRQGSCTRADGYGTTPIFDEQGRCGVGPRLPLVVISPYAKQDYVSHAMTTQSSIVAFIEQNWNLGEIPGSFANTARLARQSVRLHRHPGRAREAARAQPDDGRAELPDRGIDLTQLRTERRRHEQPPNNQQGGATAGGQPRWRNGANSLVAPRDYSVD